ncbi:endonuclease/exonuclease/phosphatase family protein [uncultured Pseudokineococcus sp.]|uniref:endonuclease/exonuclease/phosphatase family protein n=1 Tax=uncultured Pseudokineococcus sp. TaxID=1642928 RepID=UPI002628903C|nr:endonuclease/exonuclease/phosphatase family protein [uncultured Pseudokineococcus sp.]
MRRASRRRGPAAEPPPGAPRPRADRVLDGLGAAVVVVLGLGALLTLAPAAAGLSMTSPWAQLVTLRSLTGAACLALAPLLALVALLVQRRRRRTARGRPRWLLGLVGCLLVTGLGHAAVLAVRAAAPGAAPAATAGPTSAAGPGDLVVTTLNVGPRGVAADEVVALALRRGSGVLALSETPAELAQEVADGLGRAGRPVQLLSTEPSEVPGDLLEPRLSGFLLPFVRPATHLLVSTDLGRYEASPAPPLRGGAVVARPADGDGPALAAVHTLPAVPGLFAMDEWRAETAAAVALCAQLPGGVVAGDLNATADHAVVQRSGCTPAATAGASAPGTWPASLPPALAAPIDHVLADEEAWRAVTAVLDDVGGSDHRALTAVLRPR